MKYCLYFSTLIFLLTSCSTKAVGALPQATATSIPIVLSKTTATAFVQPSPTQNPTQIPCDPHIADYCITDGHFIFQRPIHHPANDSVDKTYRYASTANG